MNVRGGPGKSYNVVFSAAQGQPLKVLGQSGSWVQIATQDNEIGWVAGWLVYLDSTLDARSFVAQPATESQPVAETAPAPSAASASGDAGTGDLEEHLARLKSLYEMGLITEEEYDLKRQVVLDSL